MGKIMGTDANTTSRLLKNDQTTFFKIIFLPVKELLREKT